MTFVASATRAYPKTRLRRLRASDALLRLCAEHRLSAADLVWPLFVKEGLHNSEPIASMRGVERLTCDLLPACAERAQQLGIPALALFPVVAEEHKSEDAREAWRKGNLMSRALEALRGCGCAVIVDVALDPYTTHGHDGIVKGARVDNQTSLVALGKQALSLAESGADLLAPSDMMDGRIAYLRERLDAQGFHNLPLISYAAKFASHLYAPFREALKIHPKGRDNSTQDGKAQDGKAQDGKAQGGKLQAAPRDKRSYQLDCANAEEALWEIALDLQEGADMVIVKPALPYLDIVRRAKEAFAAPLLCYHVSGEYAALAAAGEAGLLDERACLLEQLLCCKRAGASAVITYYAPRAAEWINERL